MLLIDSFKEKIDVVSIGSANYVNNSYVYDVNSPYYLK